MKNPEITIHYADGRPSETRLMTDEEFAADIAAGWTEGETQE
jgi:hypothetical protein